jgi:hypothetical protein
MFFLQTGLSGENLRKHLIRIIQKRITELKEQQNTRQMDGTVRHNHTLSLAAFRVREKLFGKAKRKALSMH